MYKLKGPDDSYGVQKETDNKVYFINPPYDSTELGREYQEWKAEGNTPDPQYTLEQAQDIAKAHQTQIYYDNLDRPFTFNSEEIEMKQKSRSRIHNSSASSKNGSKVNKSNGRHLDLTKQDLRDLVDAIDDRDDADADLLDSVLDIIDAAVTVDDLLPYLPEGV